MTFELGHRPKRRAVVRDNQDARAAIADVVSRIADWRYTLTLLSAKAGRPHSESERRTMLAQCSEIRGRLVEARTDLLIRLADAPARLSGHSRVVDVERALDGIEATLDGLDRQLRR